MATTWSNGTPTRTPWRGEMWKDWPLVVRMPDVKHDFTVMIDEGVVQVY